MTVLLWIWSGTLAVLPMQEKAALPDEDVKAIGALFDEIGAAEDRDEAFRDHLDLDRMMEELEPILRDMKVDAATRTGLRLGFQLGLSGAMTIPEVQASDIRKISPSSASEAVVYFRTMDELGSQTSQRWWLVKRDEGWRIFDWEDLDASLRASVLMGAGLVQGLNAGQPPGWIDALLKLQEASVHVYQEDFEAAEAMLEGLDLTGAPKEVRALLPMTRVSIHMGQGRLEEAAAACREAEALHPDAPIMDYQRAYLWSTLAEPEKAIAAADRYLAHFDDDVDMLVKTWGDVRSADDALITFE